MCERSTDRERARLSERAVAWPVVCALVALTACTSAAGPVDVGADDGGAIDASAIDASANDASANDAASTPDAGLDYDHVVLADRPVGFWRMSETSGPEPDLAAAANAGTYHGDALVAATLPNGDPVVVFDGATDYLSIPSRPEYSISTTGELTWEAWIRPDVLMFPHSSGGYVAWMGKCAEYAPTCEWEARMYDAVNPQGRCDRLSAYAFNPSAGLGSGADWQPVCGLFVAGEWHHVVGEYTTLTQPADCPVDPTHPGALDIWVDGVPWDQASHGTTGCMSQYGVVPVANESPVQIGSMALDSFFEGAIGKVAIYATRLTQEQITSHYRAMTGRAPSGSCASTCTTM